MLILKILVFAIPITLAVILHMVAVRFNLFANLKIPIDFGKLVHGHRLFGDSKTYRGVVLMLLFSIVGVYLLQFLCQTFEEVKALNILYFDQFPGYFYGMLYGLGFTMAELPNSFFKRRKGVPEGKTGNVLNVLIDQMDSFAGCLLLIFPFSDITWDFALYGILIYMGLHLMLNFSLYVVGVRKNPM